MMFMILGFGLFLLPILFRLALKLRLGVPMLYALLMLTVFHSWYQTNTALADGIFFALIGLTALSWVVTLLRLTGCGRPGPMASMPSAQRGCGVDHPRPISSRISRSLILIAPTKTSILKINSPT